MCRPTTRRKARASRPAAHSRKRPDARFGPASRSSLAGHRPGCFEKSQPPQHLCRDCSVRGERRGFLLEREDRLLASDEERRDHVPEYDVAQRQRRIGSDFTWRKRWAWRRRRHGPKSVLLSLTSYRYGVTGTSLFA